MIEKVFKVLAYIFIIVAITSMLATVVISFRRDACLKKPITDALQDNYCKQVIEETLKSRKP